jgi:hypothetical protein
MLEIFSILLPMLSQEKKRKKDRQLSVIVTKKNPRKIIPSILFPFYFWRLVQELLSRIKVKLESAHTSKIKQRVGENFHPYVMHFLF